MTVPVIHPRFAAMLAPVADQAAVTLTLTRGGVPLDPQDVLMAQGGGRGDPLNLIDGYFLQPDAAANFDVETGDRFVLADGQKGEIGTVWPVRFGMRRADFVLDTGGRARFLAGGF